MTVHAVEISAGAAVRAPCARTARRKLMLACLLVLGGNAATRAGDFQGMLRLKIDSQTLEGTPVAWSTSTVHLLGRDGVLRRFPPEAATEFEKISDAFQAYSQADMRGLLLREFGRQFDVSGTGNYLVVHPAGQRDRWAPRFEELYRTFTRYFAARGIPLQAPAFPLVAVVFPDRAQYLAYGTRTLGNFPAQTLGVYSSATNRVLMYDTLDGGTGPDWYVNAETIVHEATHQMAFNTAVHSRFAVPPLWISEGLATMFEARGVCAARYYPNTQDRIQRTQLRMFDRLHGAHRGNGWLSAIVTSDRAFQFAPQSAYAEAWALTFFLVEQEPARYRQILRLTAERQPFTEYRAGDRLLDFQTVMGQPPAMLEARIARFLENLPQP